MLRRSQNISIVLRIPFSTVISSDGWHRSLLPYRSGSGYRSESSFHCCVPPPPRVSIEHRPKYPQRPQRSKSPQRPQTPERLRIPELCPLPPSCVIQFDVFTIVPSVVSLPISLILSISYFASEAAFSPGSLCSLLTVSLCLALRAWVGRSGCPTVEFMPPNKGPSVG